MRPKRISFYSDYIQNINLVSIRHAMFINQKVLGKHLPKNYRMNLFSDFGQVTDKICLPNADDASPMKVS